MKAGMAGESMSQESDRTQKIDSPLKIDNIRMASDLDALTEWSVERLRGEVGLNEDRAEKWGKKKESEFGESIRMLKEDFGKKLRSARGELQEVMKKLELDDWETDERILELCWELRKVEDSFRSAVDELLGRIITSEERVRDLEEIVRMRLEEKREKAAADGRGGNKEGVVRRKPSIADESAL